MTLHMNKIAAIAQVKTRAFMGKNCIIMPIFAIGFTAVMRILYNNMDMGSSAPIEMLNAYVLSMGLVMNLGMTGIYCPCLLLAEEKEKNTLRVLMTSSVNGLEFFLGSILPVFIVTAIINFLLMPISGYMISGSDLAVFALVSILSSLTSCIIGMLLGIFAKNQVSAGTIITPVVLIFMLIPMFANMIEELSKISRFLFTGILMDMIADISTGAKEIIKPESIVILIAEVIISIALFIIFYRKNGFEKE
ncbi:MAG TPA: ABC transporter permease [Candidatus Anaerostipes excrementavium]|uniref:ABC transporter permease n=1 Tax=Candidatus Anaerostipes excrementavium TaxID=2838463 RepID=A0A9D1WXY3_9FIRM|nr:ABC transporter permease [uncultured Anaerostipes sp.]HIX69051.1 ABC transporter permease [Candidatus Anaerostipes excrementavium]